MPPKKILLSSPHMGGNELKYIHKAFDDNFITPFGSNIEEFENSLQNYLEQDQKVTVLNSGTAAIHLALIILGVQPNDEVICQSMTFSATANPIAYLGAKPVFIDSEPETWNMCPLALEEALMDKISQGKMPKAIIVVHLYGMPAKMDELIAVATKYGVPIIEDAAEALGSTYKNQKCGTFGALGILSFNGNKIITTSGGGALVCKTTEQKEKAIYLSTQARDKAPHYQHSEIGYNYRMSNVSAGIGCGQMEVLPERIFQRRKNHEFYMGLFKNMEGISVFTEPNADFYSNHWLSAILVDEEQTGFSCEDLRLKFSDQNIESRPLWKPMHLQPVFQNADYYGNKVAENLFESGLCLPSGSNLSEEDLARIRNVIENL